MGVLDELKSSLGMGARANKYRVILAAPLGPTDDFTLDALCKGASIPAKTVGTVEVWTQGRKLPVAGDAQYENTWQLTFYNTQDLKLREGFDKWLLYIDDMDNHQRGAKGHNDYMTDGAQVQQLNTSDNSVMATYKFYNLWPTGISAIDMADDQADTISELTVDFAFSHWVRVN